MMLKLVYFRRMTGKFSHLSHHIRLRVEIIFALILTGAQLLSLSCFSCYVAVHAVMSLLGIRQVFERVCMCGPKLAVDRVERTRQVHWSSWVSTCSSRLALALSDGVDGLIRQVNWYAELRLPAGGGPETQTEGRGSRSAELCESANDLVPEGIGNE